MAERFEPAPFDKYAEKLHQPAPANGETQEQLTAGLIGTFPASDPVSVTQPGNEKA